MLPYIHCISGKKLQRAWPKATVTFCAQHTTVTERGQSRTLSATNRVFAPGCHLFRDDWEPRNWIHLFNGNTTVLSVMFQQTQCKQQLPVIYICALMGRKKKKEKHPLHPPQMQRSSLISRRLTVILSSCSSHDNCSFAISVSGSDGAFPDSVV